MAVFRLCEYGGLQQGRTLMTMALSDQNKVLEHTDSFSSGWLVKRSNIFQ
jgi:hypothetical protein